MKKKTDLKTIWVHHDSREPDLLRADKVELAGNHILFYFGNVLIYKVYLDREYRSLKEALKSNGIDIFEGEENGK